MDEGVDGALVNEVARRTTASSGSGTRVLENDRNRGDHKRRCGGVGVAPAVGSRWFRHSGGMAPMDLASHSGRYLSFAEREEISILRAQNRGVCEIARLTGRDKSTISRELRRNAATRGGKLEYRASVAQWKADLVAKRPKDTKLATNPELQDYVQQRLSGEVEHEDESGVALGPEPTGHQHHWSSAHSRGI